MSTPVRHCAAEEAVAAALVRYECACVCVCEYMCWVCVCALCPCLSQSCNQLALLWPASYLNFTQTWKRWQSWKWSWLAAAATQRAPAHCRHFFGRGSEGESNCKMGQPKISVILALHSSSSSSLPSSTSLQLIEYVMSMQETNLKANSRGGRGTSLALLICCHTHSPPPHHMCSSNESGFKNEIAAKMFAHF